jgi:ABC-type multidrug transport system fused ATPase/permease subunit
MRSRDGEYVPMDWPMLKRALRYARPYHWQIALLLATILLTTSLRLLQPLIFRDLIDTTLPDRDMTAQKRNRTLQ